LNENQAGAIFSSWREKNNQYAPNYKTTNKKGGWRLETII
jgi:hypothetical protein